MPANERGMNMKKEELTEPQIPEWLQRERVKFWCRCYANLVDKYAHDDCAFRANTDLKQFDKRFLNKDDDKTTTS